MKKKEQVRKFTLTFTSKKLVFYLIVIIGRFVVSKCSKTSWYLYERKRVNGFPLMIVNSNELKKPSLRDKLEEIG